MIDRFDELTLHGAALARLRVFVSGPVCVAEQYRGSGVLRGLHRTACAQAAGRYDAGVGFIAKSNPRSHAAHVHGLGMESIGEFRYQRERLLDHRVRGSKTNDVRRCSLSIAGRARGERCDRLPGDDTDRAICLAVAVRGDGHPDLGKA